MNLRGRVFLKISGIIMLISGALGIISNLVIIFALSVGAGILGFLSSSVMLLCGLIGMRLCNEASKANTCMILGIAAGGTYLLFGIINIIIIPLLVGLQIVGLLFGLALPALYVMGAILNRKDAEKIGCTDSGFSFSGIFGAAENKDGGKWICSCGYENSGNFCMQCGSPKPEPEPEPEPQKGWDCSCGSKNNPANFCPNCGAKKPHVPTCPNCGWKAEAGAQARFCQQCGSPLE